MSEEQAMNSERNRQKGNGSEDLGETELEQANQNHDDSEVESKSQNNGNDDIIAKLTLELEAAKQQSAKNYDNYLRALADYDNLRRRSQKDREELHKYGLQNFLKELLPVLDSFEKVLGCEKTEEISGFIEGLMLVKKQLFSILENHGLSGIDAKGQRFDPNIHQAISKIEKEDIEFDIVVDEFVRGYLLHDRLLRPSMVSVATPAKKG